MSNEIYEQTLTAPAEQKPEFAAAAVAKPSSPPKQRFFYLDAMKGMMILWGIPVHACTVSNSKFFDNMAMVSGWVRMEAFIIISGFLSYMLVKRYGGSDIMKRRIKGIGTPLATVLILLNPITNFLILKFHNGSAAPTLQEFFSGQIPDGMKGTWNWHLHIWFLIVLLAYAAVATQAIALTDKMLSWTRPRLSRISDELLLLLLYGAMAGVILIARIAYEVGVKPFTSESFHFPIRALGYYAVFFVLGMAMFASPRILRILSSFHWVQFAASGLFMFGTLMAQPYLPDRIGEVVRLLAETYLALIFASLLFAFFKKFCSKENPTMKFLAESAFAVYLVHYLVIYLNAFWIRNFTKDDFTLSLLVTITSTIASMLIYEYVIRRSVVARCLLLGKFPQKRDSARIVPAQTIRG